MLILSNINAQVPICGKQTPTPATSFPRDNLYYATITTYLHKWAYATDTILSALLILLIVQHDVLPHQSGLLLNSAAYCLGFEADRTKF